MPDFKLLPVFGHFTLIYGSRPMPRICYPESQVFSGVDDGGGGDSGGW